MLTPDRRDRVAGAAAAEPREVRRPSRILHVLHSVDRGGVEMWLLHLLRHIDRERFPMDALVLSDRRGPLESELRALGCRVFYCADHRKPWVLQRFLSDVLQRHGPYDVVHSHVHYFSGAIMRIAARQRVPIRIVHSRNDTRSVESQAGLWRRMYIHQMRKWIHRHATCRIAISTSAAEDLFGLGWRRDCTIIYSGRDLSPFASEEGDPHVIGRSLGLPRDALVLGHIGRFHPRKNHAMLVDVAAEVFRREPRAWLLLIGDGPAQGEVRERAQRAGIADRVVYAGARDDVPQLLQSAMDVLLFPSRHEGLGVAVVEAQAAGLPCVIADHLPGEIDIVSGLVTRVSLSSPPTQWASAVLSAASAQPIDRTEALQKVLASDFNIERSVAKIVQIYDHERSRVRSSCRNGAPQRG